MLTWLCIFHRSVIACLVFVTEFFFLRLFILLLLLFVFLHIQECLQAKDHLNYRYFHKRALFLSIVAGHLRKQKKQLSITSVKFSCVHGNPLLPIIILESNFKNYE